MQLSSVCPSLGNADISPERVNQTVHYLIEQADTLFDSHVTECLRKEEKGKESGHILYTFFSADQGIFNYIYSYPKDLHSSERKYRADMKIAELNIEKLQEPLKSFLTDVASRIKQIFPKFTHWKIDVRLERGLSYTPNVDCFHRDSFSASVTLCYSNVVGWTTKVLNPIHYPSLNINPKLLGSPNYFPHLQDKLRSLKKTQFLGNYKMSMKLFTEHPPRKI